MPPELTIRDVDQEREEGAILYRIGGYLWLAPEPDLDTLRDVTMDEVKAIAGAEKLVDDMRKQIEQGVTDTAASEVGASTLGNIDSLVPQLQRLLFAADEQGRYRAFEYEEPEAGEDGARGEGKLTLGEVVTKDLRQPIPAPLVRQHMSGKRIGGILRDVLGEGYGRA